MTSKSPSITLKELVVDAWFGGCQMYTHLNHFSSNFSLINSNEIHANGAESHDSHWAEFQAQIYQWAMAEILQSLHRPGTYGKNVVCADGIMRQIFPFGLNADNQEIPADLTITDGGGCRGTSEVTGTQITRALPNCDPHWSVTFNVLHTWLEGIWGDHMFAMIRGVVPLLGRDIVGQFEMMLSSLPRWKGLNSFPSGILSQSFNGGTAKDHILQVILHAMCQNMARREQACLDLSLEGRLEVEDKQRDCGLSDLERSAVPTFASVGSLTSEQGGTNSGGI
ncbi:uncharacterized protein EI90DRAFT_3019939 [Cantharellus anzutake]|uniref:uncharacterized protein n=1 Tax=Cantharellus anzutake TaxID=1750568 RepID=UPI001907EA92|nr:uncharacterized protein EI90DRAFT_3019939 [Cantharellus anzutake]KAF8322948.1 hypothetical protein EI90DRAFT_3019939 [Cantharellus anzutake]